MKRNIIVFMIFYSTNLLADTVSTLQKIEDISIEKSRFALQNNSREAHKLVEKNSYRQLKQERLLINSEAPTALLKQSAQCLSIRQVYLQGITLLSLDDLSELINIDEKCINSNDINRIITGLMRLYINKGFITARVKIIHPNINGELGLLVTEGFIEKIEGGDHWVNIKLLFPDLESKPLKLSDLDQGLDQANRLQSNVTKLDILPGNQVGGSIIRVHNQHNKPWLINASIDNYGQKNTGKWQGHTTVTVDSPFGLSDFISLNINHTLLNQTQSSNNSYVLLYSLPYGAFTFSGFTSLSSYEIHQKLLYNTVKLHGETQQYGLRSDYVFYRDSNHINSFIGQLTHKRVDNYFDDVRLVISSPTLTLAELGINHLQVIPSGILNANISIERGFPSINYETNATSANLYKPFTKGKLVVNFNQYLNLNDSIFQINSLFYGQYSNTPLPGVEWLNITDRNAVRGFSQNSLSADNGWYLQNTLSQNIDLGMITLTPRLGFDVGRVLSLQDDSNWYSAVGLSSGATLSYEHMLIDFEASKGFAFFKHGNTKDPIQVLSRVSFTF